MWHCKTWPSQRDIPAELIRTEFQKLVAGRGADAGDLGVFVFYPRGSREVTLYFGPELDSLARLVDAEPCERPPLGHGMGLYIGEGKPTQRLYPEFFPNE